MKKVIIIALALVLIVVSIKALTKMNDKVYTVKATARVNQFDNLIHFDCWEAEAVNDATYTNTLGLRNSEKVEVIVSYKIIDAHDGHASGMGIEIVNVERVK